MKTTEYFRFRRQAEIAGTRDLDDNTQVDIDTTGHLCGITIEHASQRTDIPNLSFEEVAG